MSRFIGSSILRSFVAVGKTTRKFAQVSAVGQVGSRCYHQSTFTVSLKSSFPGLSKYSFVQKQAIGRVAFRISQSTRSINSRPAISYDHGASDTPLLGSTIGQLMEERAEKHPDREAFVFPRQNIRKTFAELLEESDKLAAGLIQMGFARGDRLGIWAPNYYEWIVAQYGTARAGIILVNVNPAYQVTELEYSMKKVGLKGIICPEKFKTQSYYDMIHYLCPELENSQPGQLHIKQLPDLTTVIMIGEKKLPGTYTFSEVLDMAGPKELTAIRDLQKDIQFDEPINIQFTSGTTGLPKGATLTHHNIVNNSYFVGRRMDYHNQETRICVPVPLYHCFGMVLASLQTMTNGATCVFPSLSFEPKPTVEVSVQERCTSLYGTPTMFIDMLQLPDFDQYDFSSLRTGIMGGSSSPIEVMKQVISKMNMNEFTICYGTTENSPVTYQSCMSDPLEKKVGSVGKPSDHAEVKVVDNEGKIVPRGVMGELCVRGYSVMQGYWNDTPMTARAIDEAGWYSTGDLAKIDNEGYGYIVGRSKDVIIRGGENIYPLEVEQLLYKHPNVADVQVIGVPDLRLGEEVCAWVKLKEGQTTSPEGIRDFCKGTLAHFKIPKYVHFVDSYPMTVSGKVKKYVIREEAAKMFGTY